MMSEPLNNVDAGPTQYYDSRWADENQRETPPNPERVERVCQAVEAALAGTGRGVRILEVGCGNGWILEKLAERIAGNASLNGIEPSSTGVENSRRRCPSAHVECATLEQSEPGIFDILVCSEVIEHVEDQRQFCRELASRLKPGGEIVLTTPNGRYRQKYFESLSRAEPQPIEQWLTAGQLKSLFREFDLRVSVTSFDLSVEHLLRKSTVWESLRRRVPGRVRRYPGILWSRLKERYFHRGLYLIARIKDKR